MRSDTARAADAGLRRSETVQHVACGREGPADGSPALLDVLCRNLGVGLDDVVWPSSRCDVQRWASWGALSLTGCPDRPPALPGGPWATRIEYVVRALAGLTSALGPRVEVDAASLLTARAREAGWGRSGATSLNGSARLLAASDGWVAVNLARAGDREVLPAVTGVPVPAGTEWAALTRWAHAGSAAAAADALQEVGVPSCAVGAHAGTSALRVVRHGASAAPKAAPLVVDMSAMWAGPLTAHLLHRAGARVITVEDPARPDGARGGPPRFYAALHRGHEHRHVDLRSDSGRLDLAMLLESADMVIEASRPRALRQLGLCPEQFLAARPGRTWISITGYGREAYDGMRAAFGDDAAAAGGLMARYQDGAPVFVADAIADPLTGLWAATAAAASWSAGGGHLLDVSMAGVAAEVSAPTTASPRAHRVRRDGEGRWRVSHERERP